MPVTKTELKNLKSLLSKKGRREAQLYLAEGVRLLEESVRHGVLPEKVYFCRASLTPRGCELIAQFEAGGVKTDTLTENQLKYISQTMAPQGLLGVFKIPVIKPTELLQPDNRKLLLCDSISDPGNLGTLIRSAVAFDFDMVLLSGNCAEPFNPKVVRSSAGAVFGMKILKLSLEELLPLVISEKIFMIGTSLSGRDDRLRMKTLTLDRRFLLAVGSEAEGLPVDFLRQCNDVIRIVHENRVESLNAAVAGSIIMKEVYNILNRE